MKVEYWVRRRGASYMQPKGAMPQLLLALIAPEVPEPDTRQNLLEPLPVGERSHQRLRLLFTRFIRLLVFL